MGFTRNIKSAAAEAQADYRIAGLDTATPALLDFAIKLTIRRNRWQRPTLRRFVPWESPTRPS